MSTRKTTHAKLVGENAALRERLTVLELELNHLKAAKAQALRNATRTKAQASTAKAAVESIKLAGRRVLDLAAFHQNQSPDSLAALKHLHRLTK